MMITKLQHSRLFDELEKVGWHRRDGLLYAPHETVWLRVIEPWTGDLQSFHDRMMRRLNGCHNLKAHQSEIENRNSIDDVTSLIQVLHTMISEESQLKQLSASTAAGAGRPALVARIMSWRRWFGFLR